MKKIAYQFLPIIIFLSISSILGARNANAVVSQPSPHASYPDLIIESVSFWGDEGTDWTPRVKIKNVGDASMNAGRGLIRVKIKYIPTDGQEPSNWSAIASFTEVIGPQETFELHDELMSGIHGEIQEGGTYIAEVWVLTLQNGVYTAVSWENRSNNSKTGSIPPKPFSDLIITEVFFPSSNTRPIFKIKNIGEAKFINDNFVNAGVRIRYLDANGQVPEGMPANGWHSFGGLNNNLSPGEEAEIKLDRGFFVGFPDYTTNYIAEINITIHNVSSSLVPYMKRERDGNNQISGQLPVVTATDLVVEDVFFPKRDAYPVIRIKNNSQARFYKSGKIDVAAKLKLPSTTWLMTASLEQSLNAGETVDIAFDRKADSFAAFAGGLPEASDYIAKIEIALKGVVGVPDNVLNYIQEDGSNNEKRGKIIYKPIPSPELAKTTQEITDKLKEVKTIKYPIKQLGNCKSKEDCKSYCDKPKNVEVCAKYGVENSLLTEEEAKVAEEINKISETNKGPGNCVTKESCAKFCGTPANIDACLNYAEKNNWMNTDDLVKARKVAGVLKGGGATPGACNTLDSCKTYCSDNTHVVECVSFGKSAGILSSEEAAEAEKIAPLMQSGATPGGKKTREEIESYCETNRDECDKFFDKAGVKKSNKEKPEGEKPEENAPAIFQGEGGGPGGCKTKAECDAYCDSHPGECDEQVKQAGGEIKEVTVPCLTNAECKTFCADTANAEACKNIVIEESPEEAEASKPEVISAEIEKLRQNILEMPVQGQDCVKEVWGVESFERVMAGQAPETPVKAETLQSCYGQGVEQRDQMEMQNKPKPAGEGDEDDLYPPQAPTSQLQKISTMFASVLNGVWLFQADPTRKPLFMPESKYYCNTEHGKCISKLRSCYYDRDENFDQCRDTYRLGEKQCTDKLVDCVKGDSNTGASQNISEPQKSEQTEKPKPSEPEKEVRCSGAHQEYDSDLKECACVLGYWQRPDSTCRESITYRLSLDVDSAEEVENLVDTLKTNNRQLLTLTLQNGETLRLGVIKLGNGQIIFTKDGERFYNNLGHTIKPSFMRRAVRGVGNLISWLNPLRRFHTPLTDKYPGENADRETKWQIARNVLKDLEKTLEKEKELAEYLNDIREKLADHKDNLEEIEAILRLGGESDDVISVLADMGRDEIKGFLKDKLISFPAETIKELHDQLNTDDFAEGVRVYIGQREIDYTPEQVFDDPPEDLITSGSVAREYDLGKRLLFIKYEEAYQRYLLSKEFNK